MDWSARAAVWDFRRWHNSGSSGELEIMSEVNVTGGEIEWKTCNRGGGVGSMGRMGEVLLLRYEWQ